MQRQVLTEQALYYGDVDMPKRFWDIDRDKLINDILQSTNSTLKNFHSHELGIC